LNVKYYVSLEGGDSFVLETGDGQSVVVHVDDAWGKWFYQQLIAAAN